MDLCTSDYDLILGIGDLRALEILVTNLPSPTSLDSDGNAIDNELFSSNDPSVDTEDFANIKQHCIAEIEANARINIDDWCNL